MKYLLPTSLAFAVALAGCSTGTVNVKKKWSKDLSAYSFVPLYPARQDVEIGDIRIHLAEGGSQLFDSRLMWNRLQNGIVRSEPLRKKAILPGIDVTRLGAVDIESLGLMGILGKLLGGRIEASSSLHIALKGLTTNEISDVNTVYDFKEFMKGKLSSRDARTISGFCAAAITLGDDEFEKARISIITRTVGFSSMQYFSGNGVSNVQGGSTPKPVDPAKPATLGGQNGFVSTQAASILGDETFKTPVIIGVDAIMLNPYALDLGFDLKKTCKEQFKGVIIAPPSKRS